MDPWATPSPWADDSATASAASAASPSPQRASRSASPVQAVALDAVALDPWAHSTLDAGVPPTTTASSPPAVTSQELSPEPKAPPLLPPSAAEPAPWVDDGPSAWGGAPPEPLPIVVAAPRADESDDEQQPQRPASPWGGAEALPPPAASAAWTPAQEEQQDEPVSATSGWGGESADPWAPPGQSQPKWPGTEKEESKRSDAQEEDSADIAVRDLDAEFAAQASIKPASEAEKPVTAGSRVAAVLSSWRRPANTSSIEATKPTPAAAAAAAAEKEVTAEAPTSAKPNPGWAHVPKKSESGLAAKLSGLWGGAGAAAATSSIVAAPRVVSAAEEDEEEERAPRASTSIAPGSNAVPDLFGDMAEAKPSAATQAPAGLAKWLRWGRKQGAPPPEGMSADDLAWLENLPDAPAAGGAAGAAGGADDLEQWLSSSVSSKAGAPQAANAPPVPVWARGMQAQGQRARVDSTPRGGVRAQLASSRTSSPAQAQPPRLAAPPIAPPRRAEAAGGLLDYDEFEEAPARAAPAGGAAGSSRIFSGSSTATSATADSADAFGEFESWEPQTSAGALGLSNASQRASLAPSPASPARATVGSGLGRGRYAQRNAGLAGGRNPAPLSMDYSTDEEDESIYGRTSPARTRANVTASAAAYSDRPHDANAHDEDAPDSADSSWNWGKYTDQPSALAFASPGAPSPPPKSSGRDYALPRQALVAPAPAAGVAAARGSLDAALAKASTPPSALRALSPQFAMNPSSSRTSTPPILPPPPAGARGPLLPPPPGTRSSLQPTPTIAAPQQPSVAAVAAAAPQTQKPALSNGPGLTSDDLSFFDSLG